MPTYFTEETKQAGDGEETYRKESALLTELLNDKSLELAVFNWWPDSSLSSQKWEY